METSKDGGAAFPGIGDRPGYGHGRIGIDGFHENHCPGMSLLDYFAGQAMSGDWACQAPEVGFFPNNCPVEELRIRADLYYRMGAAMLAAREAQKAVAQ